MDSPLPPNPGGPQLTIIMKPGISIIRHDSCKSRNPHDQSDFVTIFAPVVKRTHGCIIGGGENIIIITIILVIVFLHWTCV